MRNMGKQWEAKIASGADGATMTYDLVVVARPK